MWCFWNIYRLFISVKRVMEIFQLLRSRNGDVPILVNIYIWSCSMSMPDKMVVYFTSNQYATCRCRWHWLEKLQCAIPRNSVLLVIWTRLELNPGKNLYISGGGDFRYSSNILVITMMIMMIIIIIGIFTAKGLSHSSAFHEGPIKSSFVFIRGS